MKILIKWLEGREKDNKKFNNRSQVGTNNDKLRPPKYLIFKFLFLLPLRIINTKDDGEK